MTTEKPKEYYIVKKKPFILLGVLSLCLFVMAILTLLAAISYENILDKKDEITMQEERIHATIIVNFILWLSGFIYSLKETYRSKVKVNKEANLKGK